MAPVWELRRDTLFRGKRIVSICSDPIPIQFDGKILDTVMSHFPVTWLLRFPPRDWEIHPDDYLPELRIDAPEVPPNWLR